MSLYFCTACEIQHGPTQICPQCGNGGMRIERPYRLFKCRVKSPTGPGEWEEQTASCIGYAAENFARENNLAQGDQLEVLDTDYPNDPPTPFRVKHTVECEQEVVA